MNGRRVPPSLALSGALGPVWLLAMSAAFATARPGYDMTHAISELGQQGSTNALLWNVFGFGGSATWLALFALVIQVAARAGWLARMTLAQGVFLVGGAIFSCDPGCPPMMTSWQGWGHTVFGLAYFATASITPLVAWRSLRRREGWSGVGRSSLIIGLVLVTLFAMGPFVFGPEGIGFYQRLTIAIFALSNGVIGARCWQVLRGGDARIAEASTG